jgi:hypothetical protein
VVHVRGRSVASAASRVRSAHRASQLAFYRKHRPGWVPFLRIYLKLKGWEPDRPSSQGRQT